MSKNALLLVAFVAFVAACAAKEEVIMVEDPVTSEPTFTGKYN
ncbi:hypothetical protein OEW28_12640 [Defluviimonas sp. WL0002]|uniref:Lipoprotein n=1 Tax=Albidovulum marisflavi TaxID=2984159 RepID=A0ABT2ZEC0_9RHOB|nr:hypothetical protein [Defluviimonas sp. WL0002]MCV2869474.1 hypothetical protein [Defluviimonas sp. WL0002]